MARQELHMAGCSRDLFFFCVPAGPLRFRTSYPMLMSAQGSVCLDMDKGITHIAFHFIEQTTRLSNSQPLLSQRAD